MSDERSERRPETPDSEPEPTSGERRPYRKPEIETGDRLERTVLASCDAIPDECDTPTG